jgi:hypothetical protein
MAAAQTATTAAGTFEINSSTNSFIADAKAGWHLLTFENGDVAVARFDPQSGEFVWGGLTAPGSPIVSVSWLGSTVTDIASHISTWWDSAIANVPGGAGSQTAIALVSSLDNGTLSQGQPVIYNTSGTTVTGTTNQAGSEATATTIIPSPSISTPGILTALGSLSFWKGIGLVLAGVLILVFAGLELRSAL